MKILLVGGMGFVGTKLTRKLVDDGHKVAVLDRFLNDKMMIRGVEYTAADSTKQGEWQESVAKQDVVINLAGAGIFTHWNREKKKAIYESRIRTTKNIVDAVAKSKLKTKPYIISTSAAGYYGFRGDERLNEDEKPGTDFLATVARDWEKEAVKAEKAGAKVVRCRFGVVLGKNGGALSILTKLFNYYLGSRLGSGKQYFSWIHEDDLIAIYLFLIKGRKITGPINCTAPEAVTNSEMTKILSEVLNKPVLIPFVPSFALKILLGEFGSMLLKGQNVYPEKLLKAGFKFRYPEMRVALQQIAGQSR